MTNLPKAVAEAATKHKSKKPVAKPVEAGDFRFVPYTEHENRLMLVTEVRDDTYQGLLCHPYLEMAGESGMIFEPKQTGLPYAVVVQLACHTYSDEVGDCHGQLDADTTSRIADIYFVPGEHDRTGIRIGGIVDSRWDFFHNEIEVCRQISQPFLSRLLD